MICLEQHPDKGCTVGDGQTPGSNPGKEKIPRGRGGAERKFLASWRIYHRQDPEINRQFHATGRRREKVRHDGDDLRILWRSSAP
jgi:hypothetical protein